MNEYQQALEAIQNDDFLIYDVAAKYGQIVENVKHMQWFIKAVANAIEEEES